MACAVCTLCALQVWLPLQFFGQIAASKIQAKAERQCRLQHPGRFPPKFEDYLRAAFHRWRSAAVKGGKRKKHVRAPLCCGKDSFVAFLRKEAEDFKEEVPSWPLLSCPHMPSLIESLMPIHIHTPHTALTQPSHTALSHSPLTGHSQPTRYLPACPVHSFWTHLTLRCAVATVPHLQVRKYGKTDALTGIHLASVEGKAAESERLRIGTPPLKPQSTSIATVAAALNDAGGAAVACAVDAGSAASAAVACAAEGLASVDGVASKVSDASTSRTNGGMSVRARAPSAAPAAPQRLRPEDIEVVVA